MKSIRAAIVHLSARKVSDWRSRQRSLDYRTRRDRNLLSRALEAAEDEIDGASEFVNSLSGNEMAWLLEDIAEAVERRLQSGNR